jgi:ABC-type spermidine/putrescine transport system permease subunit II
VEDILSNRQYLQALWGSVQLGNVTATISTLYRLHVPFAVARHQHEGQEAGDRARDHAGDLAALFP